MVIGIIGGGASGMMAAIAATRCENPIVITDAHCVAKSYPNFWEDYAALGGILQEVSP